MALAFSAWTEEFTAGQMRLDSEHRHFVGAINEIHFAEQAGRAHHQLSPLSGALADFQTRKFGHA